MPVTAAVIGGGLALGGGLLQGRSNEKAANTSANAQLEAARIAADAAKFRPVGMTSRFGASSYGFDDKGNVNAAGYELSPEAQQYQDYMMGLNNPALNMMGDVYGATAPIGEAATGLFGLGGQYLGTSPEEQAQKYMSQQQALLAPAREREDAALRNQLYNTGRSGLSVGGTNEGGLGASNPEWEALQNARAMQDLQLAAQSTQGGMDYTKFGAGLFNVGSGMLNDMYGNITGASDPFTNQLGISQGLEDTARSNLTMGMDIGGRNASAGAAGGGLFAQGAMNAAQTRQGADSYNPMAQALMAGGNVLSTYRPAPTGIPTTQGLSMPQGYPAPGSGLNAGGLGNNPFGLDFSR